MKYLLILLVLWFALRQAERLMLRWRARKLGVTEAELVIDEKSGRSKFVRPLFRFLSIVVITLGLLVALVMVLTQLQA